MGNCCGVEDPRDKYAAGGNNERVTSFGSSAAAEAAQAVALLDGSAAYSSSVELAISAQKLPDVEMLSKSDPMAILYEKTAGGAWKEVGRTELISNTLNPTFVKRFRLVYNFEKVQEMKVIIVDIDSTHDVKTVTPPTCTELGFSEFRLSAVLMAQGKKLAVPLKGRFEFVHATVTLCAEEVSNAREVFTFQLTASGLINVETFGKSDPFLEISRRQEDGVWLPVYKTEVIDNNLNPVWKPIILKATQLTNGDPYRPLKFRVLDYENNGSHRLLGEVETNSVKMQECAKGGGTPGFQLVNTSRHKAAGTCGYVSVKSFSVEVHPTFLDYLQAGIELNFTVAIDFTGSNGAPSNSTSLHYTGSSMTPYEAAIKGVGKVLEAYDSDKVFPCFGFGGVRSPNPVSHCFPIGPNPTGECQGIEGVLTAYRQALSVWTLSGPTLFAPLVRMVIDCARRPTPHIKYHVLLILTDGAIMDMQDTTEAIIDAATLPMSILIVGIGDSPELSNMEVLDGDNERLRSGNRIAERDIVQFVHFNKFKNDGSALAAELLAELPGQFLQYMRMKKIPVPSAPTAPI